MAETVKTIHRQAMEYADFADQSEREKDFRLAGQWFHVASVFERSAIRLLLLYGQETGAELEPTLSILERSANCLEEKARQYAQADAVDTATDRAERP